MTCFKFLKERCLPSHGWEDLREPRRARLPRDGPECGFGRRLGVREADILSETFVGKVAVGRGYWTFCESKLQTGGLSSTSGHSQVPSVRAVATALPHTFVRWR